MNFEENKSKDETTETKSEQPQEMPFDGQKSLSEWIRSKTSDSNESRREQFEQKDGYKAEEKVPELDKWLGEKLTYNASNSEIEAKNNKLRDNDNSENAKADAIEEKGAQYRESPQNVGKNASTQDTEIRSKGSSLDILANETPNETMDINELDKPLSFIDTSGSPEKKSLTDEEKQTIKEERGWSDEIVNSIRNMDEYEKVYKNAGLHEETIDGRPCLIKDIDMDYYDEDSEMTNRERMAKGRSPIDAKTGEKIELHHMGQDVDSPLVELCENSEHGGENDKVLHDKKVLSWRNNPILNNQYNNSDRPNHWKTRSNESEV